MIEASQIRPFFLLIDLWIYFSKSEKGKIKNKI